MKTLNEYMVLLLINPELETFHWTVNFYFEAKLPPTFVIQGCSTGEMREKNAMEIDKGTVEMWMGNRVEKMTIKDNIRDSS